MLMGALPVQGVRRAEEEGLVNGKAKKGKAKRGAAKAGGMRRRGGNDPSAPPPGVEAGPPVVGAFMRIDEWPADASGAASDGQARHASI